MYTDSINRVLDRIEQQLTEDISYKELAELMAMSVYELRRIFAFIVGTPLSDYIRQRRLSCAVFDLQSGDETITEIAAKYRYDSPSSFSRAFRDMQGISPSEARRGGVLLKTYPRASFKLTVTGADSIDFRLMRRGELKLCGYTGIAYDSPHDCCEEVWSAYYSGGYHDRLCGLNAFAAEDGEYAAYVNYEDTSISCTIGALLPISAPTPDGMDEMIIPPALWGVFDVVGTIDAQINNAYFKTVTEWLDASIYERDPDICNLEAFPVEECEESETMKWRIYYPLKLKKQ